jgi:hypothetical protein
MKKVLLFIAVGILLLAIPVTVFLVGKNQETRKRAAPATTLELAPATYTVKVNDKFTLEAKINTGENQVNTIKLQVVYDPKILTVEDIANGPLAPTITLSGKTDPSGKAAITVGAQSTTQPVVGTGTVAYFYMKVIAASASPTTVRFAASPDTYITSLGENDTNVLVGTTNTTVTILSPDEAPVQENNLGENPVSTISATPTYSPEALNPADDASGSASAPNESTPSALTIIAPAENQSVTSTTPLIHGSASPGTNVTLTIQSEPQTVTVTADASGNWSYTPTIPLETGTHSVVAQTVDPLTGEAQSVSSSFVVAGGAEAVEPTTQSAIPVSGSIYTTMILLFAGVLLIFAGALTPIVIR